MHISFSSIEKYLGLAIIGVHAAASAPDATNPDKKASVLDAITAATGAVGNATDDPHIAEASAIIDLVAGIINSLAKKKAATVAAKLAAAPITMTVVSK